MGPKRNRIGLALGGGGARGLAHIGVLRVFERASVHIDLLVGTSIGALVGGAHAAGLSTDEIEERVEAYLESPGFQSSALKALGDARGGIDLHLAEKLEEIQRAVPGREKWFTLAHLLRKGNRERKGEPVARRKVKDKGMNAIGRRDIRPGARVRVVQKQDQRSGKLTEGVVRDILTKSSVHPHGIKVRLEGGVVGRVKQLVQ